MITEMYSAFQGHPSSAPSGSLTPTLALTDIQENVKGENANNTTTEETPSHTEGGIEEPKSAIPISLIPSIEINKGKGITTESDENPSMKLVKASSIVRPDPDEPKDEEEARLVALTKPEVIKVVQEEAEKIGLDPKKITSAKAGAKFKKAQDAKHEVLKRQHTKKVKKSLKLRKHKYDSYIWTVSSRLKLEPITDIKIHPKTKPVVITLREIILKKKNAVVKDLMNSLSRRYERLRQIPKELGIQSALPLPKHASSETLGRKRRHMELEPEIRIPGLECNRALPKNVSFINNMVIEEPEYEIFFTDVFGDQAFQRWSDIDRVVMEALVSCLVAASMVKSLENARFNMKLKKLIAEHPDQEKLKSKKVKMEALGYKMD
ncbi:hypothetical protein Tco_0821822 [Tanacetum coccineum]|uniref:Uncharacterized protein n=1 Tax=Tanacetum coccineum TaxID=301880 RepID=A0ABQ5AEA9_9ASTR